MLIREIKPDDAGSFINLINKVESESEFMNAKRNKHSVYLVIGILAEYRGRGIGTKLFEQLENCEK